MQTIGECDPGAGSKLLVLIAKQNKLRERMIASVLWQGRRGAFAVIFSLSLFSRACADGTWSETDIGSVGIAGSSSYNGSTGVYTIKGTGWDIWDVADGFHYVHKSRSLSGDGVFVARLLDQEYTHEWAKSGLMIRQGMGAGSINALIAQTPSRGLSFQYRTTTNGATAWLNTPNAGTPLWIKLVKLGGIVAAYESADGEKWECGGAIRLPLEGPLDFGLAVSSHNNDALGAASFDKVSLTMVDSFTLPEPWLENDIGKISIAGGAHYDDGRWELFASGKDIWANADAFHYVYQPLNGNGSITAHFSEIMNTDPDAKAGIMFRESGAENSKYVAFLLTPERGIFERRIAHGVGTKLDSFSVLAPLWVKLTRRNDTITAFTSRDGLKWKISGTDKVDMDDSIQVGLALTAHDIHRLGEASFDHVSVVVGDGDSP